MRLDVLDYHLGYHLQIRRLPLSCKNHYLGRSNFYFAENKNYYEQTYPDIIFTVDGGATMYGTMQVVISTVYIPHGYNYISTVSTGSNSHWATLDGTNMINETKYDVSGKTSVEVRFISNRSTSVQNPSWPKGIITLSH